MKILMIMNGKGIGGAELQFLELVRELAKRHEIRLISLNGDRAVEGANLPDTVDLKTYRYNGRVSALGGAASCLVGELSL